MRMVSARWVIPIDQPPIGEGAVALADDGTVLAVGPRAEVQSFMRGQSPAGTAVDEERALGVLVPALVNAHCHLELSPLADAITGGAGLVAWTSGVMRATATLERQRRVEAAAEAAASAVRLGTAAVGDVGNTLAAAQGIGRAGLRGILFHELVGSREAATGNAIADAAREKAEADAEAPWPARLVWARAPHAPYSAATGAASSSVRPRP